MWQHHPIALFLAAASLPAFALASCSDAPEQEVGVTATATPAAAGHDPAVERGARLYRANCQSCHGDQQGRGGMQGAPLHNASGHTWHHPDAQLMEWVLSGKPPGLMPAFGDKLTEEEVEAILAFIKTWWTPEQPESQADVTVPRGTRHAPRLARRSTPEYTACTMIHCPSGRFASDRRDVRTFHRQIRPG